MVLLVGAGPWDGIEIALFHKLCGAFRDTIHHFWTKIELFDFCAVVAKIRKKVNFNERQCTPLYFLFDAIEIPDFNDSCQTTNGSDVCICAQGYYGRPCKGLFNE